MRGPDPLYLLSSPHGTKLLRIHGKGSPIRMSKILLPIELETPCHLSLHGNNDAAQKVCTLVPAARSVSPMTTEGIRQTH